MYGKIEKCLTKVKLDVKEITLPVILLDNLKQGREVKVWRTKKESQVFVIEDGSQLGPISID